MRKRRALPLAGRDVECVLNFMGDRGDFSDFSLEYSAPGFRLKPGPRLALEARDYLSALIAARTGYRAFGPAGGPAYHSLYQPALNTAAGKRSLVLRLLRKFRGIRAPAAATIGVTRHCQCECEHCSAEYHMSAGQPDLDRETLCAALSETVALGATTIILLGGEPLIRRDLERVIGAVDRERATVTLFTNGELLSEERCMKLRAAGLAGVFVSIDSPLAAEHDEARRRTGLFVRARAGVQNARGAGLRVALSSYLTSARLATGILEQTWELAAQWGADEVTFFDAIPVGRLSGGQHTFLTSEDRRQIQSRVRALRKLGIGPVISAQSTLTSECGSAFCFAANTQFYLSSSGAMCPCDFTPLTIGRYPERSIAELWNVMTTCEPYVRRAGACRMQDQEFHRTVLDQIPADARLPFAIQSLKL